MGISHYRLLKLFSDGSINWQTHRWTKTEPTLLPRLLIWEVILAIVFTLRMVLRPARRFCIWSQTSGLLPNGVESKDVSQWETLKKIQVNAYLNDSEDPTTFFKCFLTEIK